MLIPRDIGVGVGCGDARGRHDGNQGRERMMEHHAAPSIPPSSMILDSFF
jgi:hypothetical protein